MKKYLLPNSGNFYKAAMHVHTNVSDGKLSPQEVKRAYKELGYSIIAYTDHEVFVPHNDLTDEDFLAINSVEVAVNDPKTPGGWPFMRTCHINLYAKDKENDYCPICTEEYIYVPHSHQYMTERMKQNTFKKEYSTECFNRIVEESHKYGFLACFNHPIGSLQNYEDYIGMKNLWGIEWYNAGSNSEGMMESMQAVDDLLRAGQKVFPVAGDDSHDYNIIGCCFDMVKADNFSYEAVMSAFEKGDFYSSTGPEFYELYLEDNIIHISCSGVSKIFVNTERRVNFVKTSNEEPVTYAEFDLKNYIEKSHLTEEHYSKAFFRVTLVDEKGNEAHSRAYFLSDII